MEVGSLVLSTVWDRLVKGRREGGGSDVLNITICLLNNIFIHFVRLSFNLLCILVPVIFLEPPSGKWYEFVLARPFQLFYATLLFSRR